MSEIFQELLKSSPYAIIELYELHLVQELHGSSEIIRFHAGVNKKLPSGDVVWKGNPYSPLPIEVDGFEYTGNGQLPRPTVRISNLFGSISTLLLGVNEITAGNDLTGAKFIRIRTLSRFIDSANFANGTNPYGTPDPNAEMPQEIYYVDRKANENKAVVEFELAAVFDIAGIRSPKRQCIANICQWTYRGPECGYTGTNYFDENDNPINSVAATNFPAGTSSLTVSHYLAPVNILTSNNRWYKTLMQADGNIVVYNKANVVIWASNTVGGTSDAYRLWNQSDGNLVLYKGLDPIWATNTDLLGNPTAIRHMDWRQESTVNTGRAGAFSYEVFGNADSYPNQSRTVAKTFTVDTRTITISYTATSLPLSQQYKDAFSARGLTVNYSWSQGPPVVNDDYGGSGVPMAIGTVTTSTGLWRVNQYFDAAVSVSSNNPWKNGDPVVSPGTYGAFSSVAAVYYVRTGSGYSNNYLSIQSDGNLVYYNSANVPLWASGYSSAVEPRVVGGTADPLDDVCGKRVSSCKARFGATNEIPFGSFPSIGSFYG
jgi:hypothetical protein